MIGKDCAATRLRRVAVVGLRALLVWVLLLGSVPETYSRGFSRKDATTQSSSPRFPVSASQGNTTPPGITYSFTNSTPVNIPLGVFTGTPYPSTIDVSNVPPEIAKITINLRMMNHEFASDIDILLVGPQGQTAIIMSDVGGGTDMSNVTITLDDAAETIIPPFGPIENGGVYRPTDGVANGSVDPFPPPAPQNFSLNSALSVFNGTNPNGQWRLFAMDDVPGFDPFQIAGGWSINITSAISGQNSEAITIPESGVASPYPSEIPIAEHNFPVTHVRVNLINFSHASPDDVDILLQSPGGRVVTLMSDVGGSNPVSNVNLIFEDSSPGQLPDNGPLVSGSYRPTDFEPGDVFPAPAPSGAPSGRMLSSLHGTVANGAWRLFIVDDSGTNVGNISGGWNILVGNTQGTISIAGGSIATPYPGEISISGLPGNITRATVAIRNFSHTSPDDTDLMLVGPDGRRIVLMSDAGGTTEVGGLNLTFDDTAAAVIPDNAALTSGTYKPADYEPGEVFPPPAPQGPPTGNTLQTFFGGTPNGIWRLYAVNENGASFGSVGGNWSVTLQTSTSACLFQISSTVQAFPVTGGTGSFGVTQATGCGWTASTTDSFITITSGSSGGGNGAVNFSVAANQGPARTGTIDVTNGVLVRSFQVQQPSGCPLAVSQSTLNFAGRGGSANVSVSAGGACLWTGSTLSNWIQITSQPQTGDGTLTFTVQPNTTRLPRSGTIDIGSLTVNVNQAPSRAASFDFDGDSRTDVSVFRPSTGAWWIAPSGQPGTAIAHQFGISTDEIAPADYDGDMKTDVAVYRNGVWYALKSTDGTVTVSTWGTSGDIPVPADYNSDGKAELAVFRPSSGVWWILRSDGTYTSTAFGIPTDIPTPGDYDGDGRTDVSVYRPATASGESGTWWILNSAGGSVSSHSFGSMGDMPVAADHDGDGRDNVAVYRPTTGYWYRSLDATRNYDAVQWGIPGDRPAIGDFDGDGKADPSVVRTGSSLIWHVLGSTSGAQAVQFGVAGDRAVGGR